MRIAATSDHHRPPRNKRVRCRTLFSFLVLHYCSRRRPQLNAVWYLTGRDQTPQRYEQLARQGHVRSFAGKVFLATIHIGVSASSETGSKSLKTS